MCSQDFVQVRQSVLQAEEYKYKFSLTIYLKLDVLFCFVYLQAIQNTTNLYKEAYAQNNQVFKVNCRRAKQLKTVSHIACVSVCVGAHCCVCVCVCVCMCVCVLGYLTA